MGGAMIAGWRRSGAITAGDMMVADPHPSEAANAAIEAGAAHNPADVTPARTVIFAVKPQVWRAIAADLAPRLAQDTVIVSVVAGVAAADLTAAFASRPVVRAMPTLACAIGQGSVAVWSPAPDLTEAIAALFAPLGAVTVLTDEDQMHAATAASGSAPAYLYAFIEALETAGMAAGLAGRDACRLARSTLTGAAALLAESGEDPAELRRQVTSPGGTTQAALEVLLGDAGLHPLLRDAVAAAARRSKELGA